MRSETGPHRSIPTSLSATIAYRKDVEKRKGPIGKDDGSWIAISTMVGQVAASKGNDRRRILDDAAKMAADLLDPAVLSYGCAFDPPGVDRKSSIARLRLLADRMEEVGSLNLAMSLLSGLAAMLPHGSTNAGRLLAQRARVTWKLGNPDLALARYQRLRRLARNLKSNELLIRSWVGYVVIAQQRGNYPDVRRWSNRIVERAGRSHYTRLESLGHHGLMVALAVSGDFSDAIAHGWRAYRGRDGDRTGQVEMLANLGRLFFDAGNHDVARSALVRVLAARPVLRIAASALGGFALASAALKDSSGVRWAASEASSLCDLPNAGYETASALLDCANALDLIGEFPYGAVLRARGSTIAQYRGYHELVFRSESLPTRSVDLSASAEAVATEIARLPNANLPDRLELVSL